MNGLGHGLGQSHDFGHGYEFRHGNVRNLGQASYLGSQTGPPIIGIWGSQIFSTDIPSY